MKARIGILILFLLSATLLGCSNNDSKVKSYPLNHVWETDGNSISMTDVTMSDRYTAPDGVVYTAPDGGELMIVRCRASFAPGWAIDKGTFVSSVATRNIYLLCEPIEEVSDSGEETFILLFSFDANQLSGNIRRGSLKLFITSGGQGRMARFRLE